MQISGNLRLGEVDSASSAIFLKLAGPKGRVLQIIGCLGPGLLGVAGILLFNRLGAGDGIIGLWVGLSIVAIYLPFVIQFFARRLLLSARLARGASAASLCTFDLDDEGMRMRWDGAEHWCGWTRVSEVFPHRDMWVVMSGLGYCVPRRLFADRAEEAAFLDHVLSRLSPDAIARSGDATLMRGGKAAPWPGYGQA